MQSTLGRLQPVVLGAHRGVQRQCVGAAKLNGLHSQPIEDRDGLAERRAAVGMEPFEEYEATMNQIWQGDSEPGDQPER